MYKKQAAKTFELNIFSAPIPTENVCESKTWPSLEIQSQRDTALALYHKPHSNPTDASLKIMHFLSRFKDITDFLPPLIKSLK